MKRAVSTLLLVVLGLASASGDIVYLRDGSTREGKVVQQSDDTVVLEIAVGSTKARVTLSRADIVRIEEKLTEGEKIEAEFAKRLKALDTADAEAVIELGKWCISQKLFVQAEKLYKDLAARDDARFARGTLALANMEYDRGRPLVAKAHVKTLLDRNPKDLDAKLLWDRITDEEKASAQKYLVDAIDLAAKGKFDTALDKLESFHDRVSEEYAKAALEKVKFPDGMKLEEFVAEVRLSVPCPACKGGVKTCPACKGKALEDGVCRTCGGAGSLVCDRCGGTGVKSEDAPGWEAPGLVRAMEKRAGEQRAEFDKAVQALGANAPKDSLASLAAKADLSASRALAWMAALDELSKTTKDLTTKGWGADRAAVEKRWRETCAQVGDAFGKQGQDAWTTIEASETGPLAQDRAVRAVRDDLVRALVFYAKTRAREKDPYPQGVARQVESLGPLVAQIDKTLERNGKVLKAFDLALKNLQAKRAQPALDIFVEIVKVSSKQDLIYLSQLTAQRTNATLPDAMAACRFEAGREKGEFGDTTDYERPTFMKLLLGQADAMAGQASNDYGTMRGYAANGKRNSAPTTLVRRARNEAEDARRWYRAVLTIPYPLSGDKRTQVHGQIGEMEMIIQHCARWFTTPSGPAGGTSIGIGM